MADAYYEALWDEAMKDIVSIKKPETAFLKAKVHKDKKGAFKTLTSLYIKYVTIVNKLGKCYEMIIQPQERVLIRKILEACIGRLLEVKSQIVELENSDFSYLDKLLIQNKMTIYDLDIEVPKFFQDERSFELNSLKVTIEEALLNEQVAEPTEEDEVVEEESPLRLSQPLEESEKNSHELGKNSHEFGKQSHELDQMSKKYTSSTISSLSRAQLSLVSVSDRAEFKTDKEEFKKEFIKAVSLIQRHERARVGRLQTQLMKEFIRLKEDIAWLRHHPIPLETQEKVKEVILRYWRRFVKRRQLKNRAVNRNIIMGLLEPSWREKFVGSEGKFQESRCFDQDDALAALEDAALVARMRLERDFRDQYFNEIGDELRYFIKNWYYSMKEDGHAMLPDWPSPTPVVPTGAILGIPSEYPIKFVQKIIPDAYVTTVTNEAIKAIGGSALIVAGHWISQRQYYLLWKGWKSMKKKPNEKQQKPISKKELKKKQKEEMALEKQRIDDLKKEGLVPIKSQFFPELLLRIVEYQINWKNRNFSRMIQDSLLSENYAMDLHLQVRQDVDEVMVHELEKLQAAINYDKGIRKKKPKKRKKEKKPKVVTKKEKKDLTGHKSKSELIQGMASKRIIVNYEPKLINEIMGECALINDELRNIYIQDPPPQWGDLRQVVKEYCILPLGSKAIHMDSPLIRSVLICGPDSITEEYVRAICTESGAAMFRLDPLVHSKAYRKKMMLHLLQKVPRMVQPAVIYVPGAEKMFYKKTPKNERSARPQLIGRLIKKIVKKIKPEDQVLVVGTSSKPWEAKAQKMIRTFNKVLALPNLDHQTLTRFWADKLAKYHSVDRYFNSSALATVTLGYEIDQLKEKLENTMTAERIIKLTVNPLYAGEFYLDMEKPEKKNDCWEWCKSSVKMYKNRKADVELKATKEEIPELPDFPDTGKKKTKLKEKKMVINNRNVYRVKERENTLCMPFMTEAEKLEDEDYLLELKRKYGPMMIKTERYKSNLLRNEASFSEYPIHKPSI